ncbi:MAG TPA: PAS domain S-box protein, partial [Anaerolineales bacterium]|nr:PAS domain S-box protein [Anaerolineales bacterium]
MQQLIRILIVEDKPDDVALATNEIQKTLSDCEFQLVETQEGFLDALKTFQPDVILSDYALPHFDGMKALALTLQYAPLTPLIIWTGAIGEDVAVDCVKAGANNYILKDNLKRLGPAILRALEEKELLTAHRQAEERYRDIFENSVEGIFQASPHGHYINLNPAMAQLYGYDSPEEMIAAIHDIARQIYVEPSQLSEFMRLLDANEKVEHFDTKNYRKDGTIIWITISARAVRDHCGDVLYYEGFIQDITQRKQAEAALQNNEKRFRALIENGLDDISLLAADGTLLWESPSINRNLGYAPNAYVGRNIFELMHPDDLKWTQDTFAKLIQMPGDRQRGSFRLRRADGTWRWVEAIATNMLSEPSVNAIVINYRDITERKQAEEKLRRSENQYRLATKATNDVIWEWNPKTHQLVWSENARYVLGYPEAEIGLDEKWWDHHLHPDDRSHVHAKLEALISGHDSIWLEEYRFRLKDGSYAHISDRGYLERDQTGTPTRMIGAMSDITSRKEAEIERQALLEIMQGFANTKDLQELL